MPGPKESSAFRSFSVWFGVVLLFSIAAGCVTYDANSPDTSGRMFRRTIVIFRFWRLVKKWNISDSCCFRRGVYYRSSGVENLQIRTSDICLRGPGTNVPKAWPCQFHPRTLVAKNEELTSRLRVDGCFPMAVSAPVRKRRMPIVLSDSQNGTYITPIDNHPFDILVACMGPR
jgi:hypothetical protein